MKNSERPFKDAVIGRSSREGAGKGDAPRNCFSETYRKNYDTIFRKPARAKKQKSQ